MDDQKSDTKPAKGRDRLPDWVSPFVWGAALMGGWIALNTVVDRWNDLRGNVASLKESRELIRKDANDLRGEVRDVRRRLWDLEAKAKVPLTP